MVYTANSSAVVCEDMQSEFPSVNQINHSVLLTGLLVALFCVVRFLYRKTRRNWTSVNIFIIGGGPIGLVAALLAVKSKRLRKLTVIESESRRDLVKREYQVCFDIENIAFLQTVGVEFDSIEGCRDKHGFYTRVGIFLDYCLTILENSEKKIRLLFETKFDKEIRKSLEKESCRTLVIVCDGKKGQSARFLGLDEFTEEVSCQTFGAMAGVERPHLREVPTQEIRAHNLNFDLSAYGPYSQDQNGTTGFSLKIFGNSKCRYMCLAIRKCDSPTLKALRTILDRSMMRNIFLKCFNTYKLKSEPGLSESFVLNHMKYSPRLFEVRYTQKCETVAYFDDCDMFVVVEGEAALSCNFHTGMDINQGIRGLHSLDQFITRVTWAESEQSISSALAYKMQHSTKLFSSLSRDGIQEFLFS
ncbi:uncharacterized protein LOC117337937 isoform X1 [Pecten maximus]|uniref:uncharacterized protein LOC117337937 isoform X1 n=1 Tax=Pecten maximus TaxID=6579 RepID=UPI001458DDC2|nr:uncharacterized protein LOC117337937 isoform X1 [Pecten maximus]